MEKGVPVRVISRTLDALKAINRHGAMTLTEISRVCDLPYATTCRVVQTLVHEGMLELEPGRKAYRPTALIQMLSYGYQEKNAFAARALPHLETLTKAIGWPAIICNRVADSMVITDTTYSLTTMAFSEYHPGFAVPIWGSATGLVYLAHCGETELETLMEVVRRDEDTFRRNWLFDETSLREELARVRSQGYATVARMRHSLNPGKTSSLAVPLFHNGSLAAATAIIFFSSTYTTDGAAQKYLEDMNRTRAAIEHDTTPLRAAHRMPLPS